MIYTSRAKIFIVSTICLLGILFALPNLLSDKTLSKMPSWFPRDRVNLGLDLRGGSQILLEVDLRKGLRDRYDNLADSVRSILRSSKIGYRSIRSHGNYVSFKLRNSDDYQKLDKLFKKNFGFGVIDFVKESSSSSDNDDSNKIKVRYSEEKIVEIKNAMMRQSIEIIRKRVDELGTTEPNIIRQGDDRILVQVPGLSDPARLKALIGKTAKLTFHMVLNNGESSPSGVLTLPVVDKGYEGKELYTLRVERRPLLTGENLVNAYSKLDQNNIGLTRPVIHFEFDGIGARKFSRITRDNIGRQFAVVLDGKIITAPVIQGHIPGGAGVITGNFESKEANNLALLLRSGALPAPLKVIEERTVGPDLGADSIRAGENATILSIVLVSIFMLIVYATFGFIANVALLFNIIFLIAALSAIGATLTLPGIAGIALTIGMAVDANVLIFERIKEELHNGLKLARAINIGFDKAIATIVDSNLTTLIGALVLFSFGSGPVRGFAITLSFGILISMFTAVSLTRVFANFWFNKIGYKRKEA